MSAGTYGKSFNCGLVPNYELTARRLAAVASDIGAVCVARGPIRPLGHSLSISLKHRKFGRGYGFGVGCWG